MGRKRAKVYRDGQVHVLAAPCATCIFGAHRPVPPERTMGMLESCIRENRAINCHEFMDSRAPVVCRGLYNTGKVAILQIAERMGVVVFDDLPTPPEFRTDPTRGGARASSIRSRDSDARE